MLHNIIGKMIIQYHLITVTNFKFFFKYINQSLKNLRLYSDKSYSNSNECGYYSLNTFLKINRNNICFDLECNLAIINFNDDYIVNHKDR